VPREIQQLRASVRTET
jgi:uncharacterized protein YwbE